MMTDRDIEECVEAAGNLALFFVGVPDEEVLVAMPGLRSHMAAAIAGRFGAEVADLIAQALVSAVWARRREIEAAGAMPSALN
jgi:hypothetical protein